MADQPDYEKPPGDEAGYLILDEHWHILSADDTGGLTADIGSTSLVGHHAEEVIGAPAFRALTEEGVAIFTLENVDFVLSTTSFQLPEGTLRLVRAQEMQATLEHVVSLLVHEVRNPLSAMRALVQGLEEELHGDEQSAAYTRRLTDEIDRLSRLLVSMSQVARLRARQPEQLDPTQLLEHAAAVFRHELARRGIRVAVSVTPRVAPICADADQMQQMLVNLVTNAADAMPQGGVITLRARLDPRGRTMLQVEDTGIGMSAPELERALRPRHSSKQGGMGLGLMIVRGIVRQHHGRMRVASVPGKGTSISVTFPAVAGERAASSE
jgi:signal transduction histidine kinase